MDLNPPLDGDKYLDSYEEFYTNPAQILSLWYPAANFTNTAVLLFDSWYYLSARDVAEL